MRKQMIPLNEKAYQRRQKKIERAMAQRIVNFVMDCSAVIESGIALCVEYPEGVRREAIADIIMRIATDRRFDGLLKRVNDVTEILPDWPMNPKKKTKGR